MVMSCKGQYDDREDQPVMMSCREQRDDREDNQ